MEIVPRLHLFKMGGLKFLYPLLLKDVFSEESYVEKKNKYMSENVDIDKQLHEIEHGQKELLAPLKKTFSFVNKAKKFFENGTTQERRLLLKLLCSNLFIKAKTPLITAKFPLTFLKENRTFPIERAEWEEIRTLVKLVEKFQSVTAIQREKNDSL